MTTAEHQLVIEMFKQQTLLYAGLVELLRSRDILDRGDLERFDALVLDTKRELLERNILEDYLRSGKILGVMLDESQLI
jgi:hypothetical protein